MRDVLEGRARLDDALREAVKALSLAKALDGEETLDSVALAAGREIPVQVSVRRVWGVPTPTVSAPPLARAADGRGTSPTSWGPSGAEAAHRHEEALEVLLRIASRELHLARLGEETQETSRRSTGSSSSCSRPCDGRRRDLRRPRRARPRGRGASEAAPLAPAAGAMIGCPRAVVTGRVPQPRTPSPGRAAARARGRCGS